MLIHMGFFLVVVMVLNKLLVKPVLKVMDARKDRVDGNLHAAEKAGASAKQMREEYLKEIESAKKDAQTLREKIKKEGEAEEDRIIKAARGKAGDLVAEVREKIAAEFKDAQAGLRRESQAMGKEIAGRILGRQV
jgi:F-type H+-transporting ATPase subunit b